MPIFRPSISPGSPIECQTSQNSRDGGRLGLYLAYLRKLLARAARLTGDGSAAEDLLQDAWMRFEAAAAAQPQRANAAYLWVIVDNLVRDWRRRRSTRCSVFDDDAEATATQVSTSDPTPEAQAIARDELRSLARTLQAMPPRMRTAVEMHRLEGVTLKQIAARLGISVTTAHTLVADGLARCSAAISGRE